MNAAEPSRQPGAPPPGEEPMPQARQAVTALSQAHALGLIRLISGNKFTPLNVQWAPGTYDFGAW